MRWNGSRKTILIHECIYNNGANGASKDGKVSAERLYGDACDVASFCASRLFWSHRHLQLPNADNRQQRPTTDTAPTSSELDAHVLDADSLGESQGSV